MGCCCSKPSEEGAVKEVAVKEVAVKEGGAVQAFREKRAKARRERRYLRFGPEHEYEARYQERISDAALAFLNGSDTCLMSGGLGPAP
jgi:hypothetical protein